MTRVPTFTVYIANLEAFDLVGYAGTRLGSMKWLTETQVLEIHCGVFDSRRMIYKAG
jgi:hypothetical protein